MKNSKRIFLTSAVAIMLAPLPLSALPQNSVQAADLVGLVGIIKNSGQVVDDSGQTTQITLPNASAWKLGESKRINGQNYYQVATNQWVAASAMTISDNGRIMSDLVANYDVTAQNVGTVMAATVLNDAGQPTGVTLPNGSTWKLGQLKTIAGVPCFKVGTNEWITAAQVVSINGQATTNSETTTNTVTVTTDNLTANSFLGKIGTAITTVQIVNASGQNIGKILPQGSTWKLGTMVKMNGVPYVQVATNEYVAAALVPTKEGTNSNSTTTTDNGVGTVGYQTPVYDGTGKMNANTLPAGSSWKLGQKQTINGAIYYQVSTNGWVPAGTFSKITNSSSTTSVITPTTGAIIGTLDVAQKVYNTETNTYTRILPLGSSWKISKVVVNSNGSYWGQVSSNEWIWMDLVTLSNSDATTMKSQAVSEPSFAMNVANQ